MREHRMCFKHYSFQGDCSYCQELNLSRQEPAPGSHPADYRTVETYSVGVDKMPPIMVDPTMPNTEIELRSGKSSVRIVNLAPPPPPADEMPSAEVATCIHGETDCAYCLRAIINCRDRTVATLEASLRELQSQLAAYREWITKNAIHSKSCSFREWECSQPECGETHSTPCNCGLDGLLTPPPLPT